MRAYNRLHLLAATARRSEATQERAQEALRRLARSATPVTFTTAAEHHAGRPGPGSRHPRLPTQLSRVSRFRLRFAGQKETDPPAGRQTGVVRVALGTDEHTPLVDDIHDGLVRLGHDVVVVADGRLWPDAGRLVGEAVAGGDAECGVVCCWTGTGVSMAANKVPGVRAALCTDAETARGARRWNDANVLALGLRLTSTELAQEMLRAFLTTQCDPGEEETLRRLHR